MVFELRIGKTIETAVREFKMGRKIFCGDPDKREQYSYDIISHELRQKEEKKQKKFDF